MARSGVHHVDIVVSSLEDGLRFYRELLEPLGYTRAGQIVGERGEPVWYLAGDDVPALGLREATAPGADDRYAVGLHHVAFVAPSREAVDERFRWACDRGLEIENKPQEWPYGPG